MELCCPGCSAPVPLRLTYSPSCLDGEEGIHTNAGCCQSWQLLFYLAIHRDLWSGSVVKWFKIKQPPTSCYQISQLSILSAGRNVWSLKMKHSSKRRTTSFLFQEESGAETVSLRDKTEIQRGVSNRTGLCTWSCNFLLLPGTHTARLKRVSRRQGVVSCIPCPNAKIPQTNKKILTPIISIKPMRMSLAYCHRSALLAEANLKGIRH